MAELAEVLSAQPVERSAVQLGRSTLVVVDLWLEGLSRLRVVPGVLRDVAVVDEHVRRRPVLRLARQPVTTLEQQDALARRRESVDERAAARAAADDDHVVRAHPPISSSRSATMIRAAASISARCENAWGKLPRCLAVLVSNSSAYRPRGDATRSRRSIRSRARCSSPTIASADTSQKE